MMLRVGLLTATAAALCALPMLIDLPVKLIWNASPSVPTGLYWLRSGSDFKVGDLVVVAAPAALADFLTQRGYLPLGLPLLKRVAAGPGQVVCRAGLSITVDGVLVGQALRSDRDGRALPVWQGCRRISATEIFLMNVDVPNSLDGRYFGPLSQRSILGHAIPIWVSSTAFDGREAAVAPSQHHVDPSPPNLQKD
jgi:conjugative transfer signal peptidase TraF